MLLGKLPDIRNTKSGQELIAIGLEQCIEQGIKKGREEGLDQGKLIGQVQLTGSLCDSIPTVEAQLRSMSVEQIKSRMNEFGKLFETRQR